MGFRRACVRGGFLDRRMSGRRWSGGGCRVTVGVLNGRGKSLERGPRTVS